MCVSVKKKEEKEECICNFKVFAYTAVVDIKVTSNPAVGSGVGPVETVL